jgi:hypothetical protein
MVHLPIPVSHVVSRHGRVSGSRAVGGYSMAVGGTGHAAYGGCCLDSSTLFAVDGNVGTEFQVKA